MSQVLNRLILSVISCFLLGVYSHGYAATQGITSLLSTVSADTTWQRPNENFVNWENPQVHPLDITPDGNTLLAVNTADNSLLLFDTAGGVLRQRALIPVGLDPVSVRVRNNNEAWVVNHISDSISVIDLNSQQVIATLTTDDEPADVVFAGKPQRAFVSASQVNRLNVFDPQNMLAAPKRIMIDGEDPRALAVSLDGSKVYVAIFESGNGTTLVTGGKQNGFEVDLVRHPQGPYGGVNVPPNRGTQFLPAINPNNIAPPPVSMIVRKSEDGKWFDDNQGDWTRFISGDLAGLGGSRSGRVAGWDLPDRDLAIIDANVLTVTYQRRLMNSLMALAVNPVSGSIAIVGTDATNEIRWEPNLQSTFLRVNLAQVSTDGRAKITDLNPHLNYQQRSVSQATRQLSIGDPRGIAWSKDGQRAFITGMGSNNLILIDQNGKRLNQIRLGTGPTGVVLHPNGTRGFVLNKFSAEISEINLTSFSETQRATFFDPTPKAIKAGRAFLYDTQIGSGLGHIACASCHIDGRTDRLSWDLGNPAGNMASIRGFSDTVGNPIINVQQHPMKGPLLTMTLQDIIGHPSMHWSGDKANLGHFADAFKSLQGALAVPTLANTKAFESFLDSIYIPPNPYRNLDNHYSTQVQIPGPHGSVSRVGNADIGRQQFEGSCRACHDGHSGRGNLLRVGGGFGVELIRRPPTWRNFYERFGLWFDDATASNSGFGFQQDGSFDSTHNESRSNNLMAFMLSFNGRFPYTPRGLNEGNQSKDTHAAVGIQVMFSGNNDATQNEKLMQLLNLADAGAIGIIAKGVIKNQTRGYAYIGGQRFQADRETEIVSINELRTQNQAGNTLVYTAVPKGSEVRMGIDHDNDGVFDQDERDLGKNPLFADSITARVVNVAPLGKATQSSNYQDTRFTANLAIDGDLNNFTHTKTGQTNPSWSLELDQSYSIHSIILNNRIGCCGGRLRDITVYVLDASGKQVMFKSHFLNRHNREAAPNRLVIDLIALTGAPVTGRQVKIVRSSDPLLLGSNGGGNVGEANVLSLAEVQVFASRLVVPATQACAAKQNVAQLGAATQSSTYGNNIFPAGFAIDGRFDNFTHTAIGQSSASWRLALDQNRLIHTVVLHNRQDCCKARLSDIQVTITDADNNQVFKSPLLNINNVLQSPDTLSLNLVELTHAPILGRNIIINRQSDPLLVGSNGQGNNDERDVLSLGEVEVLAYPQPTLQFCR